jgi:hypothetical protein
MKTMTTEPFKLTPPMIAVAVFFVAGTVLAAVGGVVGWGLEKPIKEPISIREGSMRRGHTGTTFFIVGGRGLRGGGLRGGK